MITIDIKPSVRCSSDYSLFISFPYNTKIVSVLRNLPTRYYIPENKEWEVPLRKLQFITEELKEFEMKLTGDTDQLEECPAKFSVPENFKFKTTPFNHQVEGLQFGLTHDRWLLGDEQGLGKTKQVIDIAVAKKVEKGYKHCLIICGVNGLKWNWVNEIATHSDETGHIIGQRVKKGKTVIGATKDKLEDLKNIRTISSYFLITNVESLRDKTISALLSEYCKTGVIEMVAIDEIHKCKNPSSQQGKGILKLQPECRIAMTGTPLMNTPMDLFIILKWLGYEKYTFYTFKNHYCVMGGYGGYEVVGYRHMDELQDRVDEIMLRRLKSDVLDLPAKLYVDEFVEMTPKQEQIYKEITAEIRANIDQIKLSNNPLAEFLRMRQATGYTGILSSTIKESAKLERLEELVDEAVENNKKVVIFSNWAVMVSAIMQKLQDKYYGVVITGDTPDNERQTNVETFQTNDICKFILGTIGAMGTGLTLTAGTVVIFTDHPWTRAAYDQAVDRCHRIGQSSNITVYNLLCKNTIDEKVWNIVNKKGEMSDMIIDGKLANSKTEVIEYLIS